MLCMDTLHRFRPFAAWTASALLMTCTLFLLLRHAQAVRSMRETGLPAAIRLMRIEERAAVLQAQNEAAQLHAALRTGTETEILRLSVLPEEPARETLFALWDILFAHLRAHEHIRSLPTLTMGDVRQQHGDGLTWRTYPFSFTVTTTEEGLRIMDAFMHVAGMLTVSDLLSDQDIDRLLLLTEKQNPAAITSLEHFLSADLLRFAQAPQAYEDQLTGALTSPLFAEEVRGMFAHTQRRDALLLLREIAPLLQEHRLWPMRFLSVDTATITEQDGWITVAISLHAAGRGGNNALSLDGTP
jgi:hypothetical protein